MSEFVASLPKHQYIWVESKYIYNSDVEVDDFVRAVWFGIASIPGRVWGCHIMLECGAIYRHVPPHAICFARPDGFDLKSISRVWNAWDAQLWDCYGWNFTTIEYTYLFGLQLEVWTKNENDGKLQPSYDGNYLFTIAPYSDGFSDAPEQSKEFIVCKLHNGRMTIQPTNRVLFTDLSFTNSELKPVGLKSQTDLYSCES